MNIAQYILVGIFRLYKAILSPMLMGLFGPGAGCRFEPTCSSYATEAVRRHGALKGLFLALKRLGRCHPWGDCGCDPVPKTFEFAFWRSTRHPPKVDFIVRPEFKA